jgi:hypothetical protein
MANSNFMPPSPADSINPVASILQPELFPSARIGGILFVAGVLLAGLGLLIQGAVIIWFFGQPLPFGPRFNDLDWGEALAAIFVGTGVVVGGLGWALKGMASRRGTSTQPGATKRSGTIAGPLIALLGALVAASGEYLLAAMLILTLEGIANVEAVFGRGWYEGGPTVLLGVGVLVIAIGLAVDHVSELRRPFSPPPYSP